MGDRRKRLQRALSEGVIKATSAKTWRPMLLKMQRKIGLTPIGLLGVVIAILLWLLGYLVAGKTLYLFAYGAIGLILAVYFTGRRSLPLTGERSEVRARAREGEVLGIDLILHAKRKLSTIVLEEELPERLAMTVQLPLATLHAGEDIQHSYRLYCKRRGVYKLGPLVVRWGDPIGLTEREQVLVPEFELLVHPSIEHVSSRPLTRHFEDPPIRPPFSKPFPSGLEFYGMRDYQPGDDLRRIVWRAFARTGRLLVREAEQGITDQITVILDTNKNNHSREETSESFEAAVRAAASLAARHLHEGYTVNVETNEGPLSHIKMRGNAATMQVLDGFARLEMSKKPLEDLFTRLLANNKRDAHTILITPRLTREVGVRLQMLLRKGVSILVVAVVWEPEAEETVRMAAALGCQVVELRPGQSIANALFHEVGAGTRG